MLDLPFCFAYKVAKSKLKFVPQTRFAHFSVVLHLFAHILITSISKASQSVLIPDLNHINFSLTRSP
jgi:hypothetical protein